MIRCVEDDSGIREIGVYALTGTGLLHLDGFESIAYQ